MAVVLVNILEDAEYQARVDEAVDVLNGGGVAVLPTETVYGVAGLLNQPQALARLKELRGVNGSRPFTIHVAHRNESTRFLGPVSELGERMMKKLWPGPVGIMFQVPAERRRQVAEELGVAESDIYEGEWITLRCPDHPIATEVIHRAAGPVVLTAGGTSQPALKAEALADEIGDRVDLVLNAGPTRYSKPSTLVKAYADRYEIARAGVYDERIIERLMHTTILFVCSGNTCRSPMAEAIARNVLAKKLNVSEAELENRGISVISAGSFAMSGARAAQPAIDVVKEMGLDLSRHRSRPLTVELIHQADLIFAMSRSHVQAVTALVPSAVEKVTTLDPAADIEDPIGGDLALYSQVASQLQSLIDRRLGEQVLK